MKNIHLRLLLAAGLAMFLPGRSPGQSANCVNVTNTYQGSASVNYGGLTNAFNAQNRASLTVGQVAVGDYIGQDNTGIFGYWGRYLMPPLPPQLKATEGDLPDRIIVSWTPDPLGSAADAGFKIYRNGSYLAVVDKTTKNFTDFNILAGEFYTYEVSGVNQFGEGSKGSSLGFLNPNGVVTGQVRSTTGNPVPGATVELTPTLGKAMAFNGDDHLFAEYSAGLVSPQWTVSFWVKVGAGNDGSGILDFGKSINKNWWFLTPAAGQKKGVVVGISGNELSYAFPDSLADAWHYIAATHNGSSLLLYVDGELVNTKVAPYPTGNSRLYMGSLTDETKGFKGSLDEVRLFNRQLSQTELQQVMHQTVPTNAPGLMAYWKFDEGVGSKSFSLAGVKDKAYLCGPEWSNDRPEVKNAGISDATGFYQIEGVNYGSGTTFSASASKSFYFNQSLEFNRVNQQYVELPDFDLPDTSTITLWVKGFDLNSYQQIVHKKDPGFVSFFDLNINAGQIELVMGSTVHQFGMMPLGFHQMAMTMIQVGNSINVNFYLDGILKGSVAYSSGINNWSGSPWRLGVYQSGSGLQDYFSGLIDEIAFFNKALTPTEIQTYYNTGTDPTSQHLEHYFNFNEGSGDKVTDMGFALGGQGTLHGATWATVAAIPKTAPHEFSPNARLVTLNPSNTSTDQVDFTDQSTIPVSGFVRFDGTACFAEGAEILINGQSHLPQVFTDKNGEFLVDLEPGATARLSPKFKNHTNFTPQFWDVVKASTPVAGILFRDKTPRKVTVTVAGGLCKKGILFPSQHLTIKIASVDGCFEKKLTYTLPSADDPLNQDITFTMEGLPPDTLTVSISDCSNDEIKTYFQNQGGRVVDLAERDTALPFLYFSNPNIDVVEGFQPGICRNAAGDSLGTLDFPVLQQLESYTLKFKVFQDYAGGVCPLDTADFTISNGVSGMLSPVQIPMSKGLLSYTFKAGEPNITDPFTKTMTLTATQVTGEETTPLNLPAYVLGKKATGTTFATTSPEIPLMILRDPPGDGSQAYIEQGESVCNSLTIGVSDASNDNKNLSVSAGLDVETSVGLGFSVTLEVNVTSNTSFGMTTAVSNNRDNTVETCVTTNKRFATSDADDLIGDMSDLFVGGALNFNFGVARELRIDPNACAPKIDTSVIVALVGIPTTFVYSKNDIQNTVIPNLQLIGTPAALKSIEQWNKIVQMNEDQKNSAVFVKNVSFGGGVYYEESVSTERTEAVDISFTTEVTNNIASELGIEVNGVGLTGSLSVDLTTGKSRSTSNSNASVQTAGYSIHDDDTGDIFSVNILKDKKYGTPVFRLIAGETSCPWESPTQKRNVVNFQATQTIFSNLSSHQVAEDTLLLGNESESFEDQTYVLYLVENLQGAHVSVEGTDLTQSGLEYTIPSGGSLPLVLRVDRGNSNNYVFDVKIGLKSACESSGDEAFEKIVPLKFTFLEPCSEVNMSLPLPGWVANFANSASDSLDVRITDYDENDNDLALVRVQYRRALGDGDWINITPVSDVPRATLLLPANQVSYSLIWNIAGLQDGPYELRALTTCTSQSLEEGISAVIPGRIEKSPPQKVGLPEPADGVLSPGDAISILFTEEINCAEIIKATMMAPENIGLYNTETGELVPFSFSCTADRIVILPLGPMQLLENKVLRMQVDKIEDLVGNPSISYQWEFFVDNNPMHWVGSNVKVVKYPDQTITMTRQIENSGGQTLNWSLDQTPNWVHISPKLGQLAPGASETVTFEFKNDMVLGDFKDTIMMLGTFGDEPLILDARVVCRPPEWTVDPGQFDLSMTMTLELNIEGDISHDEEDIIAAFVNGEVRGVAKVQYNAVVNRYLAFLTVYSNDLNVGNISFQIWDASHCQLFGTTLETFVFDANETIGLPNMPQVIHTNNLLLRNIPLNNGWNWVSFNLQFPDNSLNAALASLNNPSNGLIKSQTAFSTFNAGIGWVGSLTGLLNPPMYQLRVAGKDTIDMLGHPILPSSMPTSLTSGWNWIGFLPTFPLPINEALASLMPTAANGDIVKSQTQFAQYLPGFGWVGNLDYMEAPKGYLLKRANGGVLTYPDPSNLQGEVLASRGNGPEVLQAHWSIDPSQYEQTSTIIGILETDNMNATQSIHELGAFVGNEVRGNAQAIYIAPLQSWMFFLTTYANTSGEQLNFKLFDSVQNHESSINETLTFIPNGQEGTVQNPVPFTLSTIGISPEKQEAISQVEVSPNPFSGQTTLCFQTVKSQEVMISVTDMLGVRHSTLRWQTMPGLNTWVWDGSTDSGNPLPTGIYTIQLEADGRVWTQKVLRMP